MLLIESVYSSLIPTKILTKQNQKLRSWSEFYSLSESFKHFQFHGNKEQQISPIQLEGNFYVHNSLFNSLKESEYGGGIFINTTSEDSRLLIEESYFYNCTATYRGGGIYKESNGHSVINKVCGIECNTKSDVNGDFGPFCDMITANEEKPNKNYVFNSHIYKCANEKYGYPILLYYGETSAEYINMSHNYVMRWSCFDLHPSTKGNSYASPNWDSDLSGTV